MTKAQRTSRGRWLVVILSGFLGLSIGLVAVYSPSSDPNSHGQTFSLWDRLFRPDVSPRRPMPRSRHIKAYGNAFRMYANDHETLPYSPDGTTAALYALKDYLDPGDSATESPVFDDERRLLTNCPFDYINAVDFDLDSAPPLLVILAEAQADANGGRYCLTADGHPQYIASGKTCDVGKELNETD